MRVKISTIDKLSKQAPQKYIDDFLNKSDIHVSTDDEVDLNHLSVGDRCKVIGIDRDQYGCMYLNVYQRVA